ncbi:MAG: hypothetical protein FWG33_02890 [Oscillospiraceae bacterium]|nr:hypothetical protein [Oscillospiraceae bacterium]
MKKMILLLKFLMNFIAAVWGMVLGIIIPVSLLVSVGYDDSDYESRLGYAAVIWLAASVLGFVVPCFLVKFKLYKTAVILTLAGAVLILYVFDTFPANWGAYMPLLVETVAVVLIMILDISQKKKIKDNAPSESILGEAGGKKR